MLPPRFFIFFDWNYFKTCLCFWADFSRSNSGPKACKHKLFIGRTLELSSPLSSCISSQHFNERSYNVVGHNTRDTFGTLLQYVAACWVALSKKKISNSWACSSATMLHDVARRAHHFQTWANNTQCVAIYFNKIGNTLCPTRLNYVAFNECDRLAGAFFKSSQSTNWKLAYQLDCSEWKIKATRDHHHDVLVIMNTILLANVMDSLFKISYRGTLNKLNTIILLLIGWTKQLGTFISRRGLW